MKTDDDDDEFLVPTAEELEAAPPSAEKHRPVREAVVKFFRWRLRPGVGEDRHVDSESLDPSTPSAQGSASEVLEDSDPPERFAPSATASHVELETAPKDALDAVAESAGDARMEQAPITEPAPLAKGATLKSSGRSPAARRRQRRPEILNKLDLPDHVWDVQFGHESIAAECIRDLLELGWNPTWLRRIASTSDGLRLYTWLVQEATAREVLSSASERVSGTCGSCGLPHSDHGPKCSPAAEAPRVWVLGNSLQLPIIDVCVACGLGDDPERLKTDLGSSISSAPLEAFQKELALQLAVGCEHVNPDDIDEVMLLGGYTGSGPAEFSWGDCWMLISERPRHPTSRWVNIRQLPSRDFNYRWMIFAGSADQLSAKFQRSLGGAVRLWRRESVHALIAEHASRDAVAGPLDHHRPGRIPEMRHNEYAVD